MASNKSNTYLYGTENVPPLPREAITARIDLLKSHRDLLLLEPGAVGSSRVNAVVKAIDFWENLK